jgi:DNA-binding transcriptional regulator GbsR (MarR family)
MARTGIAYLDVVGAADGLLAENRSVTIDNVREALGHKGSKSTLSPLLKRWRAEHQQPERVELGIPEDLFLAAKNIYDTVKKQFEEKLEATKSEHAALKQTLQDELAALQTQHATVCTQYEQVSESLAVANTSIEHLREKEKATADRENILHHQNDALKNQIDSLSRELANAHRQFEHFQTMSAEQRTQERQTYEQKLMVLEQTHSQLHEQRVQQQLELGQKNTLLALCQAENQNLNERLQQLEIDHNFLRQHNDQHEQRLRDHEQARAKHAEQCLENEKVTAELKTELAVKQIESEWINKRHARLKKKYRMLRSQTQRSEPQTNDPAPCA